MLTVGIVFGGCSVEHEISILSAIQVMAAIDENKYKVIPIYLTKNNIFTIGKNLHKLETFRRKPKLKKVIWDHNYIKGFLYKKKLDCVICCVHGRGVEGGELAGFLELNNIAYTSIGVMGASIAQDKIICKDVLAHNGFDVIPYFGLSKTMWKENRQEVITRVSHLQYPLIVKAAKLGSSIGIYHAFNDEELLIGLVKTMQYDTRILVEEMLEDFSEYNCSIIGKKTISQIEEVISSEHFLSFKDKYTKTQAKRIIPAQIDAELEAKIYTYTKEIANILDNKGVIRIDYLFDNKKQKLYVNEVNSIPGSLGYYLYESKGIYFDDLMDLLINDAIKDHHFKTKLISSFSSNVLNMEGIKK